MEIKMEKKFEVGDVVKFGELKMTVNKVGLELVHCQWFNTKADKSYHARLQEAYFAVHMLTKV